MVQLSGWVARMNGIRNDRIREIMGVSEMSKKVQERRLNWYGRVMKRGKDYIRRRVMEMWIKGNRARRSS